MLTALMTVRENLYFSAALRSPLSTTKEWNCQIDRIITELQLEKCANRKVTFDSVKLNQAGL